MTDPAHFTDPKWAAQERARQAREALRAKGLPKAFWSARGATLLRDGQEVAYLMRLRWAMTLPEAKALCSHIADALNASPDPDKGQAPQTRIP